jgi:hypothetical protein
LIKVNDRKRVRLSASFVYPRHSLYGHSSIRVIRGTQFVYPRNWRSATAFRGTYLTVKTGMRPLMTASKRSGGIKNLNEVKFKLGLLLEIQPLMANFTNTIMKK